MVLEGGNSINIELIKNPKNSIEKEKKRVSYIKSYLSIIYYIILLRNALIAYRLFIIIIVIILKISYYIITI